MIKNIHIVLGLNFGDEGKGITVARIAKNIKEEKQTAIVIRFSGSSQAGHRVVTPEVDHVFSSIGSGALYGFNTYYTKHASFDLLSFYEEFKALKSKIPDFKTKIYLNENCTLLLPTDKEALCKDVTILEHGTTGVGYFETVKRNKYNPIYTKDTLSYIVLREKLKNIMGEDKTSKYLEILNECKEFIIVTRTDNHLKLFDNLIFEGTQGILLDKKAGFYPHCTPSNTTSKNVFKTLSNIKGIKNYIEDINIYKHYVSRTYITRHGNGNFPFEPIDNITFAEPSNQFNDFQKSIRYGHLEEEILKYSIYSDMNYNLFDIDDCNYIVNFTHADIIPYETIAEKVSSSLRLLESMYDIEFKVNVYDSEFV